MKDQYLLNGYIKLKNFLSNDEIEELKEKINKKDAKLLVPFSQEPWGFGNLLDDNDFKIIYENKRLKSLIEDIIGSSLEFNHLMAIGSLHGLDQRLNIIKKFIILELSHLGFS